MTVLMAKNVPILPVKLKSLVVYEKIVPTTRLPSLVEQKNG